MPSLDFEGANTRYATHGLHAYAAKCPPQLVRYGLRYYSRPGETVLDPMAGSGTTLLEARLHGRRAVGYDFDPLACLIARVKTRRIAGRTIARVHEQLARRVARDEAALSAGRLTQALQYRAQLPEFINRDYWFAPPVARSLALLAWHIEDLAESVAVRDFFWVAFSSLILARTSVANARDIIHSRHHYLEHKQTPDVLARFRARVQQMSRQMEEFAQRGAMAGRTRVEVRWGDARQIGLRAETVDLVFTSPPYVTALDYTRAHFLAVAWMEQALGLDLDDYRARAAQYIGSERAVTRAVAEPDCLANLDQTNEVLARLAEHAPRQATLTRRYFHDMHCVFGQIARVLRARRHALIVVCPSHIRKVAVPTHEVLAEIARAQGLRLKYQHTRTISERRRLMPYLQEAFGQRMDVEYVLVLQKTS